MNKVSGDFIKPSNLSVDRMGREYSDICGYSAELKIPLGSRVRIHARPFGASLLARHFVGDEAVVVSPLLPDPWGPSMPKVIAVRLLEPRCDWELYPNGTRVLPSELEVLEVGNGTVIPGISYRLCEKEIWDARYEAFDFRHEGYTNLPTFLAAVYLKQEQRHITAVRGLLRQNGTINPVRISAYFFKDPTLQIDDFAPLQGDFPVRPEYRQRVNWDEIAAEFSALFKEERAFACQ